MIIFLKVIALVIAGISLLGYGWWNRDYLSLIERIFMLSPSFGLLIIGLTPVRVLGLKKLRWLATLIFFIGIARLLIEISTDLGLPNEPDINGFHLLALGILFTGVYISWRPAISGS